MKVYIAMNGISGCLPDNTDIYETYDEAVESLAWLLDLDADDIAELRAHGIIYFGDEKADRYGAQYAEITEDTTSAEEYEAYCNE